MRRNYRIGIICGSLEQAGTQRYVYELCRGMDQVRFAADLLTIAPWGIGQQFYADPIRRNGSRIRPILPLFHFRSLPSLFRKMAMAAQTLYRADILPTLLSKYDLLAVVHLDYLRDIDFMLPCDLPIVVHLTTHLCQYDYDYYGTWPRRRRTFVVCMDEAQEREATAGLGGLIVDKITSPLPINTSGFEPITYWPNQRRLTVACFMRIERDRHPLPVLRAFAELMKRTDAELLFYGGGDTSSLRAEAVRLGIGEHVRFPGHVRDIRQRIIEDDVTFAWLTAHDRFIGYAGIELGLLGVPTYFYNVGYGYPPQRILSETNGAIHSYASADELADATAAAWRCPDRLRAEAHSLRTYILQHNDGKHVVKGIETFYERVIEESRSHSISYSKRFPVPDKLERRFLRLPKL